jgi:FlaA1/EpsC-like NDP-sugar epimerase
MVEKNTLAGLRCNIFGTLACVEAAINSDVQSFIFISTDKAVRPTNIMGATKRFAELILQALATENKDSKVNTRISIVRFGNVLGSSGSVVPLFREQIEKGGPVTVTDPNIIRYFMTISEAAQLVIQAGSMGSAGEIFILDMGEPIPILQLAKDMIRLSGMSIRDRNNSDGDIEIKITGLRPGEKLYEELLIDDSASTTKHKKIMRANDKGISMEKTREKLLELEEAAREGDYIRIKQVFTDTVEGFKSSN